MCPPTEEKQTEAPKPAKTKEAPSTKELSQEQAKTKEENEPMSASMQSLVDGLMTWGDQFEPEEFALPQGMAASIAFEETHATGCDGPF